MQARRFLAAALVLAVFVACTDGNEGPDQTGPSTLSPSAEPPVSPVETPSVTVSPTRPPLPEEPPATLGAAALDCVNGWTTPPEGSEKALSPLGVIRRTTDVKGPLVVVDLRYFTGPSRLPQTRATCSWSSAGT
jgi:hypothetical protein